MIMIIILLSHSLVHEIKAAQCLQDHPELVTNVATTGVFIGASTDVAMQCVEAAKG